MFLWPPVQHLTKNLQKAFSGVLLLTKIWEWMNFVEFSFNDPIWSYCAGTFNMESEFICLCIIHALTTWGSNPESQLRVCENLGVFFSNKCYYILHVNILHQSNVSSPIQNKKLVLYDTGQNTTSEKCEWIKEFAEVFWLKHLIW